MPGTALKTAGKHFVENGFTPGEEEVGNGVLYYYRGGGGL
jgi:hypothetical protein